MTRDATSDLESALLSQSETPAGEMWPKPVADSRNFNAQQLLKSSWGNSYRPHVPAKIERASLAFSGHRAREIVEAQSAVARFDGQMMARREPATYSPAAMLRLIEARAWTAIDNSPVSSADLALARLGQPVAAPVEAILDAVEALEQANATSGHLTTKALLGLHRALVATSAPGVAGELRREGGRVRQFSDAGVEKTPFYPPHPDRIEQDLSNLVHFCKRTDLPLIARAAIAHAQFQTIHPFEVGNDDVAIALVHSMFATRGLTSLTVPISTTLSAQRNRHLGALKKYREGDPIPVIDLFCEAARNGAGLGKRLVDGLADTQQRLHDLVASRSDSAAYKVNDLLIHQPIINLQYVTDTLHTSQSVAHRAINRLVEVGILTEITDQRRYRLWRADAILHLLDQP